MHDAHAFHPDLGQAAPALFGVGSILWMIQALAAHGPGWESAGPLLLGLAAIINALANLAGARRSR